MGPAQSSDRLPNPYVPSFEAGSGLSHWRCTQPRTPTESNDF
jgi:hypothetical protein